MKFVWVICFFGISVLPAQKDKPFLSNLQAVNTNPIFTTYAAALQRSEFILDQGFHFQFYEAENGIAFTTDKAGDLFLLFKRNGEVIYELKNHYRPPRITHSYPDLLKYCYSPFEGLEVRATFFVYSSRIALWQFEFQNLSPAEIQFELFACLKNDYRTFEDFKYLKGDYSLTFFHQELPDNWVLDHNIPYVDQVQDVLLISEVPDRVTTFQQFDTPGLSSPQEIDLHKKQLYSIWGRINHQNGERCKHRRQVRFQIWLNDHKNRLLTETAPRWGNADGNISAYGYYGIELGNFGLLNERDKYTLQIQCEETDQSALSIGNISDLDHSNGDQQHLKLSNSDFIASPQIVEKIFPEDGRSIKFYWNSNDSLRYNIYRRDYSRHGYYELIARHLKTNCFSDSLPQHGQLFGYFVVALDSTGQMSLHSAEINNLRESAFLPALKDPAPGQTHSSERIRVIGLQKTMALKAGELRKINLGRGFAKDASELNALKLKLEQRLSMDISPYLAQNEELFSPVPELVNDNPDLQMLYYSAFNLMRQTMLPAEGKCNFNYYVFSREPSWGWGHGGQVFHESITMLAYVLMDPFSAMNSQRVFKERQYANGYINYRTGPYLDENIEYQGELTSSAPWYAWLNWEIYQITKDAEFLNEMYESSKRYYNFYVSGRDKDGDGLCEWGGHAVLESVRDAWVAVWDEVGWPSEFEGLDLNCLLVKEANSLACMALELGLQSEADHWQNEAAKRSQKINSFFWDQETAFYYHVDKTDNDFTFKEKNDLKRMEIIGFLPLWAGIASPEQADGLVRHLKNKDKFGRKYGIPSLAADDSYYDPKGYWNGPVWVQWNYLIMSGLLNYGYQSEAKELVQRVAAGMIAQLKHNHNFWEFYSPDEVWAGYHQTYLWAGIINRMLLDTTIIKK